MRPLKRFILCFVLLDNLLTNFSKRSLFRNKWQLEGACKKCGSCCKEIYLKITPRQLGSKMFARLAVKWITWLFDFILLRIDQENHYLVFTCKHVQPDGRCGNYFWRPSVCRNYPLVDYFEKPKLLPDCGFYPVEK
ncbi:MAG: YkgJ family cysteine cluster protein [Candidatus Margulisbacteria bacterium]|nr:YkgJ family cysteine cluster protein [Candidatus Margulisiibacteriota bacterium]